jgi:uncharacterized protein (DUF169 family)
MINFSEANEILLRYLRVKTQPLFIKFVSGNSEIPPDIMRPSTFKVKMALCQINTIARRWNMALAVTPEEVNCAAALLAFGWGNLGDLNQEEELVNFMVSAGYIADTEKARSSLKAQPFFSGEKKFDSKGVIVAPIVAGVIREPDVVLIYGNPAQIARLAQSMIYMEGGAIESRAHLGLSCIGEMIEPVISKQAIYIVPGRGERQIGMAADDEMAFALPTAKLQDLLTGLRETDEKGTRYPIQPYLFFEPRFNKAVSQLIKKIKLT